MKTLLFALVVVGFIAGDASLSWAQETMTDAKIIKFMDTANDAEVDLAKVAKHRAENKEVKDFANKMIDEHKKAKKRVKTWLKNLM